MSRRSLPGIVKRGQGGDSPRPVELESVRRSSPDKRTALVVLGMHRSGTSALTRVLNLLGADLPGSLMPPAENGNPSGFWESSRIVELHDRILASAGSSWDDVSLFPPQWFASGSAQRFRKRLLDLLQLDFGDSDLFVVKDPRIARLTPLWRAALAEFSARPRFVLAVRNPLEVAASLRSRDRFLPQKSYLLWLQDLLEAERSTRQQTRAVVLYDELLRDWRRVASGLEEELNVVWPRRSVDAAVEIDGFLSDELRNHRFSEEEVWKRSDVGAWVRRAYSAVRAWAGGEDGAVAETFDSIHGELSAADAAFGPLVALGRQRLARLQVEKDSLGSEIAAREGDLAAHRAHREALAGEIEKQRRELETKDTEIHRLGVEVGSHVGELEVKDAEIHRLGAEIVSRDRELAVKGAEIDRLGAEIVSRDRDLAAKGAEIDRLGQVTSAHARDLADLQTEIEALRGERDELTAELGRQRSTAQEMEERLRAQRNRLAESQRELGRVRRELDRATGESQRLDAALRDRVRSDEESRNRLVRAESEVLSLGGRLRARERLIATLALKQREASGRLQGVLRSRSWRLTRPLRWVAERSRRREVGLGRARRRFEQCGAAELFDVVHYVGQLDEPDEAGPDAVLHYLERGWREGLDPHPLFDTAFYLENCPEIAADGPDPLTHYFESGVEKGLDPHPLFNTTFYLAESPAPVPGERNPLIDFVREGHAQGRRPNPFFDPAFYLAEHPDVHAGGVNPLEHYIKYGFAEARDPHPLFDSAFYENQNPDWRETCATPLEHYLTIGLQRGAATRDLAREREAETTPGERLDATFDFAAAGSRQLLFDADWYLWFYPDVRAATEDGTWRDAFAHYQQRGQREGRSPNAAFDEGWYRSMNPDVSERVHLGDYRCAYEHFLRFGAAESRAPAPFVNLRWYLETNAADVEAKEESDLRAAFRHFTEVGLREGREPFPRFDETYLADNPDTRAAIETGAFAGPYHHYMFHGILHGNSVLERVEPEDSPAASGRQAFLHEASLQLAAFFDEDRSLVFETVDEPLVSVVVLGSDTAALLLLCLSALREHAGVPFELIVIDNASSDRTPELLQRVEGARIVLNPRNRHFLRAAMQGAEMARGEYLLFLNSDAMIREGALPNALALFESESRVGFVGGKLVFPSGALQEAASGLTPEGHPYAFGRDDMPYRPEYMCQRDVVYCSAAFAVTPRRVFEELGGFDSRFAPAYFEDADYCFRLRDAGYRVVFCPQAVCTHVERASSSRSSATEIIFARNRIMFQNRHRGALARLPRVRAAARPPAPVVSERDRRLLVIDDSVPLTRLGSGFPRSRMMVCSLVDLGFEVTVFPTSPQPVGWAEVYAELPETVECLVGFSHERLQEFLADRRGWFGHMWVSRDHNMSRIRDLHREQPELFDGVRIVYDAEAIAADRQIGLDLLAGHDAPLPATERLLDAELEVGSVARKIVALSERDRARFAARGHDVVHVTETIEVRPHAPRAFGERSGLLFVGAVYDEDSPNYDSLSWFTAEVLPILRRRDDLRLRIAGYWAADKVPPFCGDGIDFLGPQDDLTALYEEARVFVAPTRFSAGTPHKVVEAAAYGLPTVATDPLVEQLGWRPDHEICAAPHTDAAAFAQAILRLYDDEELWRRVRRGVLARIEEQYSKQRLEKDLARVFAD